MISMNINFIALHDNKRRGMPLFYLQFLIGFDKVVCLSPFSSQHSACSISFSLDRSLLFNSVCPWTPPFPALAFQHWVFFQSLSLSFPPSLSHTKWTRHLLSETSVRDAPPSFLKLFQVLMLRESLQLCLFFITVTVSLRFWSYVPILR